MDPQPRLNFCGKCKKAFLYPLFKCPLGPASYEPDTKAAAAGLDVKLGVVQYAWLCLGCTKEWTSNLTESFLINGKIDVPFEYTPAELEARKQAEARTVAPVPVQENKGCLWKLVNFWR